MEYFYSKVMTIFVFVTFPENYSSHEEFPQVQYTCVQERRAIANATTYVCHRHHNMCLSISERFALAIAESCCLLVCTESLHGKRLLENRGNARANRIHVQRAVCNVHHALTVVNHLTDC